MDGYGSKNRSKGYGDSGIQEVSTCNFTTPSPKPLSSKNRTDNSAVKENTKLLHDVDDLKKEISDLTGRLYEARSSRDAALRKNVEMQEAHSLQLKQMQLVIDNLQKSNNGLVKERDVDTFSQIESLEKEVGKMKAERAQLTAELQAAQKEIRRRDVDIQELKQKLKKLEGYVNCLENEKSDYMDRCKEYQSQSMEFEAGRGALEILQNQLDKCQRSWEQAKDELSEQKMRNRDVEKTLCTLEKELTTFKVDVRLLTREKKDLEEKLVKEAAANNNKKEQMSEALTAKRDAEQRATKLESELSALKSEFQTLEDRFGHKSKAVENLAIKKAALEAEIEKYKTELSLSASVHAELENLKTTCAAHTEKLVDTESAIKEKDKIIGKLQTGTKRLKEACVLLENQLKDFEDVIERNERDLNVVRAEKHTAEQTCMRSQEELRKVKISLNEAVSLKLFTEKKLNELEAAMKLDESSKTVEIQSLTTKVADLRRSNELLSEKMSDVLDQLEEYKTANEDLKKLQTQYKSENQLLKEENTRILTDVMNLKETTKQITAALSEAVTKGEAYKKELESAREDIALMEVEQAEKDLRWKSTLNQHLKLIEHLKDQNELLTAKKKKMHFAGRLFSREHKDKEPSTPLSHLTHPLHIATPQRLLQEHKAVRTLEEEAACLKSQLAKLQNQKDGTVDGLDHMELVLPTKESDVARHTILQSSISEKLEVNCVQCISSDVLLLGCENGLYSHRLSKDAQKATSNVAIEGPGAVYQIDLMPSINYAVFIEGKDRHLAWAHLNLLKACADAAACAKPKIKLHNVPDLKNCISFSTQETDSGLTYIAVAIGRYLHLLAWDKNVFIHYHRVKTPDTLTCLLATPHSVIYGSNKIYELDVKTLTVEDFMDESDESMMYAMLACRESVQYSVAILDVSDTTGLESGASVNTEYLLCFPDLAIFVDEYGRRSRSEDIMWNKLPVGVYYKHPDLFILHFNSVEIITLEPSSFTTKTSIPESRYLSSSNVRFLGHGTKPSSILIATQSNSTFEILEIQVAPSSRYLAC